LSYGLGDRQDPSLSILAIGGGGVSNAGFSGSDSCMFSLGM
jgi:hypothetical protein